MNAIAPLRLATVPPLIGSGNALLDLSRRQHQRLPAVDCEGSESLAFSHAIQVGDVVVRAPPEAAERRTASNGRVLFKGRYCDLKTRQREVFRNLRTGDQILIPSFGFLPCRSNESERYPKMVVWRCTLSGATLACERDDAGWMARLQRLPSRRSLRRQPFRQAPAACCVRSAHTSARSRRSTAPECGHDLRRLRAFHRHVAGKGMT